MTPSDRWHKIVSELETILHIHPTNTTAIAAKKADIAALVQHPDVTPEQAATVQSLAAGAAAAVPPAPPVDNAHVAPGCEQFSDPAPAAAAQTTSIPQAEPIASVQSAPTITQP
jgi:hypothetical protein